MFKHFLKTTFRNMNKNRFYVIINVIGLGIGLACAIVAYSIFKFETDFNDFHSNKDIIYKVSMTKKNKNYNLTYGSTPVSLGPTIKNSISGIDNVVRYTSSSIPIRYEEKIFNKRIGFADVDFFEVFDFPIINGDNNFINNKSNIIISEQLSGILFGDENPIGKTIALFPANNEEDRLFKISGIFKDIPENSSLQFDILTSIENNFEFNNIEEHSWRGWVDATFLKVPNRERIPIISEQLKRFVEVQNEARKDWPIESFFTERLKDIPKTDHNYRLNSGLPIAGYILVVVLVSIILLLACLNFVNTFLAIANGRLKEIGINKVLGGIRRFSIIQIMGENIILCLIALFLALTIAPFFLEVWNSFLGSSLTMNFTNNISFWIFLIALLLCTSILAGAYPAFYISRFNPIKILNGSVKYKAGGWFSKVLLTFQFLLAIIGNVAAVIFIQNSYYQNDLDLGYNKEQIIVVRVADNPNLFELKNKISQNPFINKIGITDDWVQGPCYSRSLKNGEQEYKVKIFDVGRGYFETMEFQLKEGRHFDQQVQESERGKAVIVNEKLVDVYGWKSAIGQRLKLNDTTEFNVIGLVKNYNPDGFIDKLEPSIFKLEMSEKMRVIVVNANIENLYKVNDYIKKEWAEIIPNAPYTGTFMSDELLSTYKKPVQAIVKIFLFIGIISVLLSLTGLYSLVSLNIIKRTREIGIRKVFGAPIFSLLKIINRQFIYIVLIGSVLGSAIGAALSFALMDEAFAYHIDFNILSLLIPVLSVLIISVILISKKVYKAANLNPVESLKYE